MLTRLLPHILDDWAYCDEMFWSGEGWAKGIALCDSLMLLLFMQGLTVKAKEGISRGTVDLNLDFCWKAGVWCSPYEVLNTFETAYDFPWW